MASMKDRALLMRFQRILPDGVACLIYIAKHSYLGILSADVLRSDVK